MRIALLHGTSHPDRRGAAERYLHDLAHLLDDLGHRVTILAGRSQFAIPAPPSGRSVTLSWKGRPGPVHHLAAGWLALHRQDALLAFSPGLAMAGYVTGHPTGLVELGERVDRPPRRNFWAKAMKASRTVVVLNDRAASLVEAAGAAHVCVVPALNVMHDPCRQPSPDPTLVAGPPSPDDLDREELEEVIAAFDQLREDEPAARLLLDNRDAPEWRLQAPARRQAGQRPARAALPGVETAPILLRRDPTRCLPPDGQVAMLAGGWHASLHAHHALACGVPVVAPRDPDLAAVVDEGAGALHDAGVDARAAALRRALQLASRPGTSTHCRALAGAAAERAPTAWTEALEQLADRSASSALAAALAVAREG